MVRSLLVQVVGCFVLLLSLSLACGEEILLFNGKDLDAWTFDTGSDQDVKKGDFWLVQDGVLIYRGSLGHGTLRHEGTFQAEYVLSLEWRWPPNIASGADIVLHSSAEQDEVGRRKEIRVMLNVDEAGDIVYRGTPERYDTTRGRQTDKEVEKDMGQWNQLQIICREKMITVVVNGQPVNQVSDAPLSQGAIGLGTAPVPILYRNVKLIRPIGPEHVRAEAAAKPLAAAWAKIEARKKAEELKREQERLAAEQREKERQARIVAQRQELIQQIRDAAAKDGDVEVVPELSAKALPYPRDARQMRLNTTFGMIDFQSGSSLTALAAFYLREMAQRGWIENKSAATMEEDAIEFVFEAAGAKFELELDERSDYVDVSIDTDGVDFSGMNDPAALAALGIPQPRKALLLQKEVAIPADVQRLSFDDDSCMFFSTMKLEQAFAHFSNLIKQKGYRESRRPIISDSRNYTEFKRGAVELSVNVFSDEVGSRIILEYDDGKEETVVPPLPEVALAGTQGSTQAGGTAAAAAAAADAADKTPIDVTKNTGLATVTVNGQRYVFSHVAAYRSQSDEEEGDITSIVFSLKPIPFSQLQHKLATDAHFSFMDLSTFDPPDYLVVQVGDHSTLQLSVPGTGYFRGMRNAIEGMQVEDGRIRGTLKIPEDEELGDVTVAGTADAVIMTHSTALAPGTVTAAAQGAFVDTAPPMPTGAEDHARSGTNYAKTYTAKVGMPVTEVAEFYRSTLGAQQWRAVEAPPAESGEEVLRFRNSVGTMTVRLKPSGSQTEISITKHDDQRARQDGVMPEPGKGRLIMANAHTAPVVFTIGKTDYPLKAGAGAESLQGALNYSVGPGNYTVTIKIPGQRPQTERIAIQVGTTWAIVAVPTGGYMAMQMY